MQNSVIQKVDFYASSVTSYDGKISNLTQQVGLINLENSPAVIGNVSVVRTTQGFALKDGNGAYKLITRNGIPISSVNVVPSGLLQSSSSILQTWAKTSSLLSDWIVTGAFSQKNGYAVADLYQMKL